MIAYPSKKDMLSRLLKVNSDLYYQTHLYPRLLKEAGRETGSTTVVMLLQLSVYNCTLGMPREIVMAMEEKIPEFIDALVLDKGVAEEAKMFFEREQRFTEK